VKAKTHMASSAAARAVDTLAEVKEQMADLKRREDELKLVIMADMQDAEVLTDMGEPIATWKTQVAERIDTKALRKDHPEIAALYSTESTTRVLRLKSKKD
jgi:predicted phage-related endonuclease